LRRVATFFPRRASNNMTIWITRLLLVGSSFGIGVTGVAGQERPITLREATNAAEERGPDVGAARLRANAARQGARVANAYLWPTVGVEATALSSNDPVAAFGSRLRQGRFTEADFDPAGLNHPDALTDWSGSVGLSWAPLDPAREALRRAASADADAAELTATWTRRAAAYRAEFRYLEAVGAGRRLTSAEMAVEAAESNLGRIRSRREQGMLTDADVLQAEAAAAATRAGLIEAERRVADARGRLGVAMGWSPGVVPVPVDTTLTLARETSSGSFTQRPDLRASASKVRAAEARGVEAARARLPRLEGFGRAETHAPRAFSGIETSWTVGVRVEIPVFTGFQVQGRVRAARALAEAAALDHDARLREAEAQVAEARRAVRSAGEGAGAAGAAARAADEAARLMRRRFEEGLVTTADLLGAEARAAELRAAATDALLFRRLAEARLRFLTDQDLSGGVDR
jgi:outer membrane protein TolC